MTVRSGDGPLILSPEQVASYAHSAGFRGEALVTIIAIAGAESSYDAHAVGDVDLTQRGEQSTGLWQVNFRPSRDKPGSLRDPRKNLDPRHNATAAWQISGGGSNFRPWSVYTSGAYRKHVERARQAAAVGAGTQTTTPTSGQPIALNRGGRVDAGSPAALIKIGGRTLDGEFGSRVVGGSIELSTDEVSELKLEFQDRRLDLLDRHRMTIGTPIDFMDMRFSIVSVRINQGPATPHIELLAHPEGAVRMRTDSPSAAVNVSPTNYMASIAEQVGLQFRGEPSAPQASIGPVTVEDKRTGRKRPETAWELGDRLARDLGYIAFEAAGIYHFGRPTFLVRKGLTWTVEWPRHGRQVSQENLEALSVPTCASERSLPSGNFADKTIDVQVPRRGGEVVRPGNEMLLAGVPAFDGGGNLITRVTWSLDDTVSPVSIRTEIPEDPEPKASVAPAGPGGAESAPTARSAPRGTKSSLDFVDHCLRQVGDRYIFGAEVRLDDPDPGAFDCSELIQWALAQVGLPNFPDGSINQINASTPVSVLVASRVRGALLFRKGNPNHIAVSLGDGRNTVEARGRKYGVVQATVADRGWSRAGLVPGLDYGTKPLDTPGGGDF